MNPFLSSRSRWVRERSLARMATVPLSCSAFSASRDPASFSCGVIILVPITGFSAELFIGCCDVVFLGYSVVAYIGYSVETGKIKGGRHVQGSVFAQWPRGAGDRGIARHRQDDRARVFRAAPREGLQPRAQRRALREHRER